MKFGTAVSLSAASAILGISKEAVRSAKAAGCPAFCKNGNVRCDGLLTWLAGHPEILETAGDRVDRNLELALKTRAERKLREHQLAIQAGLFVSSEGVERDVAAMIGMAKAVLLAGPASLAPQIVGLTIPEAEKLLRDWLHAALSQLHQDPLGRQLPPTIHQGPRRQSLV